MRRALGRGGGNPGSNREGRRNGMCYSEIRGSRTRHVWGWRGPGQRWGFLWKTFWLTDNHSISFSVEVAEENVVTCKNVCDLLISEKKGSHKIGHRVGFLFCNTGQKDAKMTALSRMACISSWNLSIFPDFLQ